MDFMKHSMPSLYPTQWRAQGGLIPAIFGSFQVRASSIAPRKVFRQCRRCCCCRDSPRFAAMQLARASSRTCKKQSRRLTLEDCGISAGVNDDAVRTKQCSQYAASIARIMKSAESQVSIPNEYSPCAATPLPPGAPRTQH